MSHRHDQVPLFRAPPLSCDAHFHVFGPAERYPVGGVNEKLRCAPPLAPLADYLALAGTMGFERFVFVQPSAYGRDNSCMRRRARVGEAHRHLSDGDRAYFRRRRPDGARAGRDRPGRPDLADWADDTTRQKILVENPARVIWISNVRSSA